GCWLLVRAVRHGSGRWLAASGLALGLAFQTHPTALALAPGALAYLLLRGRSLVWSWWFPAAAALLLLGGATVALFLFGQSGGALAGVQRAQTIYSHPGANDYLDNFR